MIKTVSLSKCKNFSWVTELVFLFLGRDAVRNFKQTTLFCVRLGEYGIVEEH